MSVLPDSTSQYNRGHSAVQQLGCPVQHWGFSSIVQQWYRNSTNGPPTIRKSMQLERLGSRHSSPMRPPACEAVYVNILPHMLGHVHQQLVHSMCTSCWCMCHVTGYPPHMSPRTHHLAQHDITQIGVRRVRFFHYSPTSRQNLTHFRANTC